MANLKQTAKDLGIKVDDRWSDETLKAKIAEAQASGDKSGADVGGPSKEAAAGLPVTDDGEELATEATPKAKKAGVILDEKTMLQAKAIELLIEVDPEWDEDRLRSEIQVAREGRADLQVKGAVPKAEMADTNYDSATKADKTVDSVDVKLERDYWTTDDNRVAAGTVIAVPRPKALELIGAGVASRTDALR